MDVGMSNLLNAYGVNKGFKKEAEVKENKNNAKNGFVQTEEAVYEKSEAAKSLEAKSGEVESKKDKGHVYDAETVEKLKAEVELRTAELRSLVEKLILKQNKTVQVGLNRDIFSTDNYLEALRSGKLEVDKETADKAKKEISEDGYWGVNKTSDRLVEMAKALSGNDPTKANQLIQAVKDGYGAAGKSWGKELPELCQKTLDTTIAKLEAWRDGKEY